MNFPDTTIFARDELLMNMYDAFTSVEGNAFTIYGIYVAFEDGTFTSVYQCSDCIFGISVGAKDSLTDNVYSDYQVTADFTHRNLSDSFYTLEGYDFYNTDWYLGAQGGNVYWGDVYLLEGEDDRIVGASVSIPLYENVTSKKFVGAVGVDVKYDSLNTRLAEYSINGIDSKTVFIVQRSDGTLISASEGDIYQIIAQSSATLNASDSSVDSISGAGKFLIDQYGSYESATESVAQVERPFDDDITFWQRLTVNNFNGLDWVVVYAFPYTDMYGSTVDTADLTLLLAVLFSIVRSYIQSS
jgi:hypothetical protein